MIITFKTLQQKTFKIEIDESEKVITLKNKIHEEKGDEFPVESQKLIYAGKILDDDKVISEYNIDVVKNFVVVMAVKAKKPAEKPKETGESSTSSTTAVEAPPPAAPQATTAPASETTASERTAEPEQPVSSAESALLTGNALESSITELMSLGFSREQVMRALNASFHNADRAAEYLLSGNIPDIGGGDGDDDQAPAGDGSGDVPVSPIPGAGDLSFLSSLPQFQLMRNQIRGHPEALPQLLQEIGQSNPQLLTLISQNQQAFIDLLNAPDDTGSNSAPGGGGSGGGVSGSGGGGGFQIQVTNEEKVVIDRIVAMGFPESDVIQAFFACEKNEQLTINFLLS